MSQYDVLDEFTPVESAPLEEMVFPVREQYTRDLLALLTIHGAIIGALEQEQGAIKIRHYRARFPAGTQRHQGLIVSGTQRAYTIEFPDGFQIRGREIRTEGTRWVNMLYTTAGVEGHG